MLEAKRFMSSVRVRVHHIVWFVLAVLSLVSLPVVASWTRWSLVLLPLAGMALSLPGVLLLKAVRRNQPEFSPRRTYLRLSLAVTLSLISILGLTVYRMAYRAEANPLTVPLVTMVNGDRRVMIQGMVHVGSENFYKSVVNDLQVALDDGYDLFLEGVRPADPEATEWFNETLGGGGSLSESYRSLSQACGVRFQLDYFSLLEQAAAWRSDRFVFADVTTRQMLDEWNRLNPDRPWTPDRPMEPADETGGGTEGDPVEGLMQWVNTGDRWRGLVAGIVCRGILSNVLDGSTEPGLRDRVILDFRNRHLVDRILSHGNDKVYVVFGAAHVPGVMRLLQERDHTWQVASVKWVHVLTVPRRLEGLVESGVSADLLDRTGPESGPQASAHRSIR
jgi:hypothetical protein